MFGWMALGRWLAAADACWSGARMRGRQVAIASINTSGSARTARCGGYRRKGGDGTVLARGAMVVPASAHGWGIASGMDLGLKPIEGRCKILSSWLFVL
jgi:hypothetical protein